MTIDEAIKILATEVENYNPEFAQHIIDALNLGIEALKLLVGVKPYHMIPRPRLLPGETEEVK